jgi:hypothetical protein
MVRKLLTFAVALAACGLSGCGERPEVVVNAAFETLQAQDVAALLTRIDPTYSDPLGDKSVLERDLRQLIEGTGRIKVSASEISVVEGTTKRDARVIGRLDVELVGEPTWRATGPLELDLRDDGGFHITGGFLSDLRDVQKLAAQRRAALEANDATLYGKLLHPTYRDGDVDREDTEARIARDLSGSVKVRLEPTLYKLEVRGPLAHLDEHYLLSVNDRRLPAAVARFTLRPAAGFWRIAAGLYPDEDAR